MSCILLSVNLFCCCFWLWCRCLCPSVFSLGVCVSVCGTVGVFRRLCVWWNKDVYEVAGEETWMTPAERDVAQEGYEARKDNPTTQKNLTNCITNYKRNSKSPPR